MWPYCWTQRSHSIMAMIKMILEYTYKYDVLKIVLDENLDVVYMEKQLD